MSRSDEEVIEELDSRLDYRIGWPKPLPVLPAKLTWIHDQSTYLEGAETVRKTIQNICIANRIALELGSPHLAFRYHYDKTPTAEDITIIVDCRKGSEVSWITAAKEIRKFLKKQDIQYRFELVDLQLCTPHTHTILRNEPIVSDWTNNFKEQIMSVIRKGNWQTVDVFHRGWSSKRDECPITLVVTAWDADHDHWWNDLLPKVKELWPHEVELQSAVLLSTLDPDIQSSARILTMDAIDGPLQMGASIGPKGESWGGDPRRWCYAQAD